MTCLSVLVVCTSSTEELQVITFILGLLKLKNEFAGPKHSLFSIHIWNYDKPENNLFLFYVSYSLQCDVKHWKVCSLVTKKGQQRCDLSKSVRNVLKRTDIEIINMDINNNYYFYLAFENSLCDEYITEKFFRTLNYNTVPVVMGGPRYIYFSFHFFLPNNLVLSASTNWNLLL